MQQKIDGLLVPKLRFPEFWDAGEWEEKPLSRVGEIITGNTPSTANLDNYGGNRLFVSPADMSYERYIATTKTTLSEQGFQETRPIKANSILFVCIGSTIGKIAQNKILCATNQQINSIVPFIEYSNEFIYSALENSASKITLLAGNHAVPIINKTLFSSVLVGFPSLPEQKKIADCLSSISDRITLEAQKLDTLKAHKKGLMQQLFPAEGETLPKLRFPEFRDAEEWQEEDLSKLSSCGLSNGVFNDPKKVGRGYKLVNVLDMYIDTAINEDNLSLVELSREAFLKNKVKNGDLFFTRSSLVKSGIAYSNIYLGNSNDITFDGHLIRFRTNKEILIPIFINYLLRTNKVRSQLVARGKTATMTTIGQADVGSVKLSFPHINEQQKIADCLSSLDELIAAQAQAIDTLKTHKKGLMQQLFPSVDEVKG